MSAGEDHLDSLMSHLGDFGRYQCFQVFLHSLAALTSGLHIVSLVTIAAVPVHRCEVPWLDNDTSLSWNSDALLSAIPTNSDGSFSSCHIYSGESNATAPCDKWVYNTTYYTHTRATQWDMVCDRTWMGALAQSMYMFGVFIGSIACGTLADKYGRKTVFCWTALIQLFISIGIAFIDYYPLYLPALVIYGFVGSAGPFNSGFVLTMEIVGPSKRTLCGLFCQIMCAVGIMLVPAWASVIKDAKTLQLVYGAHTLLITFHWWLMDESPRWLWSQGRFSESVNIVAKGVLMNKGPKLDIAKYVSKGQAKPAIQESHSGGLTDLFKTPRLRAKTINVALCWFANSFTYYGLALNSNKMEGNPFINLFVMASIEIPCYVMVILLLDRTGRRSLTSSLMLLGGAFCAVVVLLPQDLSSYSTIATFIGKFCISGSFSIMFNYSAEIFPTVVRNTGMGFGTMFARMGGIMSPIVSLLDTIDKRIPAVLFGLTCLMSGFSSLFLPETLNQPLPNTLEDGENFGAGDTAFTNDLRFYSTIAIFLGKFCITGSFSVQFNYSVELFPTVVRNIGLGFGVMCATVGGILSPIASILDRIDRRIPVVLFGFTAIMSGFSSLFLPETLNQPLPNTLEDGENFGAGDTAFANGCFSSKKDKEYQAVKPV